MINRTLYNKVFAANCCKDFAFFGVEQELHFTIDKPYRMLMELWDLNPTELRTLIIQETRKFLWVLDFGGKVEDLEAIRKRLRSMSDVLKQKETGAPKTQA